MSTIACSPTDLVVYVQGSYGETDTSIDKRRSSSENESSSNERRRSPRLLQIKILMEEELQNLASQKNNKLPKKRAKGSVAKNNQLPKKRAKGCVANQLPEKRDKGSVAENNQLPKKRGLFDVPDNELKNFPLKEKSKIDEVAVLSPVKPSFYSDINLKALPPFLKELLTDCATLAMKDHAIQLDYCSDSLHIRELIKARSGLVRGFRYLINFKAYSESQGEQTFEAVVWNGVIQLQVKRVRTTSPTISEWYTGKLNIPLVGKIVVAKDHVSSDMDFVDMHSRNQIIECAILALQDHAMQLGYSSGIHLHKIEKASYNEAEQDILVITFEASCKKFRTRTFEAHVRDDKFQRQVIKVGMRSCTTKFEWYNGKLCVPKI